MRGFSVPLLIIVVVLLGGFTLSYFSSNFSDNIKGVSTVTDFQRSPGFSASIISDTAAWDLLEFLCVTAEECLASLTSGKRLATASGGSTELKEVVVTYSDSWSDFSHMKIYARPSWIMGSSNFRVVTPGDVPGTTVEKIPVTGGFQDVLLIPLNEIESVFYKSATFSDR